MWFPEVNRAHALLWRPGVKSSFRLEPPDHLHSGCDNSPQPRKHPASLGFSHFWASQTLIRQFILFSAWLLSLLNRVGRFFLACSFSLWGLCVCVNLLVGVYIHVCSCVWKLEMHVECISWIAFHIYFLRQGLLLSLKLIDLAWLTSQWVSGICLSLPI